MKPQTTLSEESVVNTVAALLGVATAVVVKLWLAPSQTRPALLSPAKRRQLMREAAQDPQYLTDLREVNDDFAFADAEMI